MSATKSVNKRANWVKSLKSALEFDEWGQREEAADTYDRLNRAIQADMLEIKLTADETATLRKVLRVNAARSKILNRESTKSEPSYESVQKVLTVLQGFFTRKQVLSADFPLNLEGYAEIVQRHDDSESVFATPSLQTEAKQNKSNGGTLMPPKMDCRPGDITLSAQVKKIGLKDAPLYNNPYMLISVVAEDGKVVSDQRTPCSNSVSDDEKHVEFGHIAHIPQTMQQLRKGNMFLFFEFIHYKQKKDKQSVRCYSFVDYDELTTAIDSRGGEVVLELYKKPTDYTRKKRLNLLTNKELYLHVTFRETHH